MIASNESTIMSDDPVDGDHRSSTAVPLPNGVRQQNKKLVGIRYLFPAFDERTTLLDRARVWVARHDYKYFVDWTEEQLQSVDSALRPYAPITRDVYKLHMNRRVELNNLQSIFVDGCRRGRRQVGGFLYSWMEVFDSFILVLLNLLKFIETV